MINKIAAPAWMIIGGFTLTFGALLLAAPTFVAEVLGRDEMLWFTVGYSVAGFAGLGLFLTTKGFVIRIGTVTAGAALFTLGCLFKFAPSSIMVWAGDHSWSVKLFACILLVGAAIEFAFGRHIQGQPIKAA